jgi:hypothetical protein
MSPDLLKEATEVIMAAVTAQLEQIRGEKAPETPYDPRQVRIEQRRRTRAQERAQEPVQAQQAQAQEEGQST